MKKIFLLLILIISFNNFSLVNADDDFWSDFADLFNNLDDDTELNSASETDVDTNDFENLLNDIDEDTESNSETNSDTNAFVDLFNNVDEDTESNSETDNNTNTFEDLVTNWMDKVDNVNNGIVMPELNSASEIVDIPESTANISSTKKLPQTWPEVYLLLIIALTIWFYMSKNKQII